MPQEAVGQLDKNGPPTEEGLTMSKRPVYLVTALIALTLSWMAYSGLRAYQTTCQRAQTVLSRTSGPLVDALRRHDESAARTALKQTRFETISSIQFWGINLLDNQSLSHLQLGNSSDQVVCELPVGDLGSVAFQMRPIPFLQAIVGHQIYTILALLLACLITLFALEEATPATPSEWDVFSSLSQVVERKRHSKNVQLILLRPSGVQTVHGNQAEFEQRINRWIDTSVEFGANSLCVAAKFKKSAVQISLTDNHRHESVITLPI